MQSRAGRGHRSMLPVFIVGMPRSGSTLVEQILASHPKIAGGGERPDFLRALIDAGVESEAAPFPARVPSLSADELSWLGERYIARLRTAIPVERVNDVERATARCWRTLQSLGLSISRCRLRGSSGCGAIRSIRACHALRRRLRTCRTPAIWASSAVTIFRAKRCAGIGGRFCRRALTCPSHRVSGSRRARDGVGAKPLPPRRRCSPSNLRFRVRNGTQDAFIISEL
jgi:hypothetical protein